MGGRIATHVAAAGCDHPISGLVLLGYPLHPLGRPDESRDGHLPDVSRPMLFVQRSRDSFGTPVELEPVLSRLTPSSTLHVVTHSFKVPKAGAAAQAAVYDDIQRTIAEWIQRIQDCRWSGGERVMLDEVLDNETAANQVLLDEALQHGRVAPGAPRAFGIHDRDQAAFADAEVIDLRPRHASPYSNRPSSFSRRLRNSHAARPRSLSHVSGSSRRSRGKCAAARTARPCWRRSGVESRTLFRHHRSVTLSGSRPADYTPNCSGSHLRPSSLGGAM